MGPDDFSPDGLSAHKALVGLFAVCIVSAGEDEHGGEILFVNDLFCSLSGWAKEDIVGQKLDVIIPERSRSAHQYYRRGFEFRASPRPMGPDREVVLLHKDGKEIRVWVGLDPDRMENPTTVTAVLLAMESHTDYRRRTVRMTSGST